MKFIKTTRPVPLPHLSWINVLCAGRPHLFNLATNYSNDSYNLILLNIHQDVSLEGSFQGEVGCSRPGPQDNQ